VQRESSPLEKRPLHQRRRGVHDIPQLAIGSLDDSPTAPLTFSSRLKLVEGQPPTERIRDANIPQRLSFVDEESQIPITADARSQAIPIKENETAPVSVMQTNRKGKDNDNDHERYSDEALKDMYLYSGRYHNIDYNEMKDIQDYATGLLNQPRRPDINNKIGRLSSDIDLYNYNINGKIAEDAADADNYTKNMIKKINDFENDPDNPIEALEIKFEDRLVFIITTFFIRFIVLAIIQRAIDIGIIKSFYEGFIYYGCIYMLLFWFVVFFINVDNNYDIAYLDVNVVTNYIRSLFFYFYMGTNGISRLIIHSLLIIVIIVIPIILNIKNMKDGSSSSGSSGSSSDISGDSKEDIDNITLLSLDERAKLSKTLSLFTLFIWILTSIIASKF
jgi:hypothetical protein